MNTSQTSYFDEIINEKGAIPEGKYAYFRERLRNKIYDFVIREFLRKESSGQLSKADLARRLNKKPEQITRWLSVPSNWTLDTISDLMLAIYSGELVFEVAKVVDQMRPRNTDQVSLLQVPLIRNAAASNNSTMSYNYSSIKRLPTKPDNMKVRQEVTRV